MTFFMPMINSRYAWAVNNNSKGIRQNSNARFSFCLWANMIFTAEDVASLSTSLSRWEDAEYVCAFLVAVACAGEYIADFTDWFTGGIEERKRRLAKRSTLLLIVALALELTCLVKTNSLSGLLIGSLSDKAEKAEEDAKRAITDSAIAERQSTQAENDAGKAVADSSTAINMSGKANDLAQGARREADSFEQDIKSAKKQVGELTKEIFVAKNDLVVLQSLVSARHVLADKIEPFKERLKPLKGKTVVTLSYAPDEEAKYFCKSIVSLLQSAGITVSDGCGFTTIGGAASAGVVIVGPDFSMSQMLANAIVEATHTGVVTAPSNPQYPNLTVIVGPKNPFWIGK